MLVFNIKSVFTRDSTISTTKPSLSGVHPDRSTLVLLVSNLVTILIAVIQKWNLTDIMWVYWLQSVIIGLFYFKKILDLKNFSTVGFTINGRAVDPTDGTKKQTAIFFLFHYNFFHLGYLAFLLVRGIPTNLLTLVLLGTGFFINHLFSYLENKEADAKIVHNIGSLMFLPYLRIIPMHIIIVFGGTIAGQNLHYLVLFMFLKTFADVGMHLFEHRTGQIQPVPVEMPINPPNKS